MKYFSHKEGNENNLFFGLEMIGTAKKPFQVQGSSNVEKWKQEQESWRRKFAAVLSAPPLHKELELRFIGEGTRGEGKLKVIITGRVPVGDSNEAKEELYRAWKDVYSILRVNRNVYSFKPVTNKKDLLGYLSPFKIKHSVELCRTGLDIKHKSTPGFQSEKQLGGGLATLPLPFTGESSDLVFLCRFLAEHPYPLMVSVRVSPYHGPFPDFSSYNPLQNEEEIVWQQITQVKERAAEMTRSRAGLCRIRLLISSDTSITEPVINALGCEIISENTGLWQVMESPSPGETGQGQDLFQDNYLQIYNLDEAARVFRLPLPGSQRVPGLSVVYPYLPADLPATGAVLGFKQTDKKEETIRIDEADRDKHVYVLGQTGTGKTTLLYSMAMSDIREGRGICVLDPHDDLHEKLIARIPKHRRDDVILLDPTDFEYPVGINLFETGSDREKSFLANELIQIMRKVYDPGNHGFTGPIFEQAVRNAALTAMYLPGGGTIIDVPLLLTQKDYTKMILQHVTDERVKSFWYDMWFKHERDYAELLSYITSKFDNIQSDPIIRRILGQAKNTLNFRKIMDEGKILLVNLSKGGLGELNSYLLGSILVIMLFTAALSRYDLPPEQRNPFCLYIDEFQNFTTDTVQSMLSEARKYRLSLVLAHQNLKQLSEMTRHTVLGNVGSMVFFRPGSHDARFVQEYLQPYFFERDLIDMPNWTAVGRIMLNAMPSSPFTFQVDRDRSEETRAVRQYVREMMHNNYALPYREVDREIQERQSLDYWEKQSLKDR